MRYLAFVTAAASAAMIAGPALGQGVPDPGAAYGSTSLGRPADLDPQDRMSDPSVRDKIEQGVRSENDRKAAEASRKSSRSRPAKPEEITAGSTVMDASGVQIATIEAVEADGAVLTTGSAKVKVPLEAFGHNSKGLLLGVKKSEFDALVAGANGPAKS